MSNFFKNRLLCDSLGELLLKKLINKLARLNACIADFGTEILKSFLQYYIEQSHIILRRELRIDLTRSYI